MSGGESLSIVSALRMQSSLAGDVDGDRKAEAQSKVDQQRIMREFISSLNSTLDLCPDNCRDLAMTAAGHMRGMPQAERATVIKAFEERATHLLNHSGYDRDDIASRIEAVKDGARRGLDGELPRIDPEALAASVVANRQADRERARTVGLEQGKEASITH